MKENFTTTGIEVYYDFEDNREYLQKPLLVYTRYWNKYIGLNPNEYACYFVDEKTSTDGASIPKLFTRLLGVCPRDKEIFFPALLHDNLYQKKILKFFMYNKVKKEIGEYIGELPIGKKMADLNIKYETKKWGLGTIKAFLIWLGLYIGGRKAWDSYFIN